MEPQSSNDYLWDGSGPPDPVVANLEKRLAPLRAPAPAFAPARPRRALSLIALAAAAILVAAPFTLLQFTPADSGPVQPGAARCEVTWLEGRASVQPSSGASSVILTNSETLQFPAGARLVCEAGARVRIRFNGDPNATEIGEATVEGPCDLNLERSSSDLEKLFLRRGTLSARISASARPRLFQVGTPAGTAVDLGCIYSLNVTESGSTELRVTVGRVAFEINNKNIVIWAGARLFADRAGNITIPVDESASAEFRAAAAEFDRTHSDAALESLLKLSRIENAASLWHLLQFTRGAARENVYLRLAALAPPPAAAARERVLALDTAALEAWRLDIMGW